MWHEGIDLHAYVPVLVLSIVVLLGGFWWFEKTRRGFADVL
ncbi:hypothetical protein [Paraburkholderia graminis]|nr:hypothetical protein [Paraburkholderia graminis]